MTTTRDRYSFTHGYLEARLKLPSAPGLWPAFWLLGNGTGEQGWPKTGEVDIVEFINNGQSTGVPFSTVHWAGACGDARHCQLTQDDRNRPLPHFAQGWMTVGLERSSSLLAIDIDGRRVSTFHAGAVGPTGERLPQLLFDAPMHVRFDLQAGGWADNPGHPSQPGVYQVDYLRAWHRP